MKKNVVTEFVLFLSVVLFHLGMSSQAQQKVVVTYANPGSYSALIPAGAVDITGQVWGGGGGGGGFYSGGWSGEAKAGGGGGGAFAQKTHANGGYMMHIKVGEGGGGGEGHGCGGDGKLGGNSSMTYNGLTTVAGGGYYGGYATSLAVGCGENNRRNGPGGAGGTYSGADIGFNGQAGTNGNNGGKGGAAGKYGGAQTGTPGKNENGLNGNIVGGGGSGSHGNKFLGAKKPGGAGARGEARVIFYYTAPVSAIAGAGSYEVCPGTEITLHVQDPVTDGFITYQWQKNGVDIKGATGTSYRIDSLTVENEGSYRVVALFEYAFPGASDIEGGQTDNNRMALTGRGTPSAAVTVAIGPLYTAEIQSEGPGAAWIGEADAPEERHTRVSALCGSILAPRVNASEYGIFFHFAGYYARNGELLSTDPDYTFGLRSDTAIVALFDTNAYDIRFIPVRADGTEADELGRTTGSGRYKHFHEARAEAMPVSAYSRFVRWEDSTGRAVGADPVLTVSDIGSGGIYRAVFEEVRHRIVLAADGLQRGILLQCGDERADSMYSAFAATSIRIEAIPATGLSFRHWEVKKDGISQPLQSSNPFYVTENTHLDADYEFLAVFDTSLHQVMVSASNGRVTGAGTYKYGHEVLLTTHSNEGYHFDSWFSGETVLGTEDSLRLRVVSDTVLTAVFRPNAYRVNIRANDSLFGRVDKESGLYTHFTQLHLRALPEYFAELRYWVIDGDTLSTKPGFDLVITGPCDVLAVFDYYRPTVTLYTGNASYGRTYGGGCYEWGDSVALRAESFEGYRFDYWESPSGIRISGNPVRIDSIVSDTVLTAVFSPIRYRVKLEADGPGRVFTGDTSAAQSAAEMAYMTYVEITAKAHSGYEFIGWYDGEGHLLSRYNQEGFVVVQDTSIRAVFDRKHYEVMLFVTPAGAGTLHGAGRYPEGSKAEVQVETAPGYVFDGWFENGISVSTDFRYVLTLDKDRYLTARFTERSYGIRLGAHPKEAVSRLNGAGSFRYAYNTSLLAIPAQGYEFAAWTDRNGDTLGFQNPYLYDIYGEDSLTALFRPALLRAEFRIVPEEAGKVVWEEVRYGQAVEARAVPAYGYSFSAWKDKLGNEIGQSSELDFRTERDTVFVAEFVPLHYRVEAIAEEDHGNVSGKGSYPYLSSCTLKAEPHPHYRFSGWFDEEGVLQSVQPEWTFSVTGPLFCTARFEPETVWATLAVRPEAGGCIYRGEWQSGELLQGTYDGEIALEARSFPGYVFKEWRVETGEGTEVYGDFSGSFRIRGGEILTAVFDTARYTVNAAPEPVRGGTVGGAGLYVHGTAVALSARSLPHYRFYAWRDGSDVLSYDPVYSFKADSSVSVQAVFVPEQHVITVVSAHPQAGHVAGSGTYTYDTTVHLQAWSRERTLAFSHWAGNPDGSDTLGKESRLLHIVKADDTLYACFGPARFRVRLSMAGGSGYISGAGFYSYGTPVTVLAHPERGYSFSHWEENGLRVGRKPEMQFTVESDRALCAVFTADTFLLELAHRDPDLEMPMVGGGYYRCGDTVYVMPEAIPPGYRFKAWTDESGRVVSEDFVFEYVITENTRLYAEWEKLRYEVEIETEGWGVVAGSGEYDWGDPVCLAARADSGYRFREWQWNGTVFSEKDSLRIEVDHDIRLMAVFEKSAVFGMPYVNLAEGGSVSGPTTPAEELAEEETLHVQAKPENGYRFLYWSLGDSIVARSVSLAISAAEASSLMAHFEAESYYVYLQTSLPQGVSAIKGGGSFKSGESASLEVTLRDGYVFEGWYGLENGEYTLLSAEPQCTLAVFRTMEIEARVSEAVKKR